MESALSHPEQYLRERTVRVGNAQSGGSGFFVAPGLIVTCAHVLGPHSKPGDPIGVAWSTVTHSAEIVQIRAAPYPDLALLKVESMDNLSVDLDDDVRVGDSVYSYGYPEGYRAGDSALFIYEGPSQQEGPLLKLKGAEAPPGLSGAPLLNQRTGKVCGIVRLSRGRRTDLGARAIPISAIVEHLGDQIGLTSESSTNLNVSSIAVSVHSALPFAQFSVVGRDAVLDIICRSVMDRQTVLVHGLPGIGKSVVAAETGRRLLDAGSYSRALWLEGTEVESVEAICDAIARYLGDFGVTQLDGSNKHSAIRNLLARNSDLLLILDGIPSDSVSTSFVNRCLPGDTALLATSKRRLAAFRVPILLRPLAPNAAAQLFCDRAGTVTPNDAVNDICALLDYHPLAIVIAAGRHRVAEQPLSELHARLADEKTKLATLRMPDSQDPEHSVRASLGIAWDELRDEQRQLLRRIAFFEGRVTLELLAIAAGIDEFACDELVLELFIRSLVDRDGEFMSLHQLVKDFVRAEAYGSEQAELTSTAIAILTYVQRYAKDLESTHSQDRIELELANIVRVIHSSATSKSLEFKEVGLICASMLVVDGSLLQRRGYSNLRSELAKLMLQIVAETDDEMLFAEFAPMAATAFAAQGRYDDALGLLQRSQSILVSKGDEEKTANLLLEIGNIAARLRASEYAYLCYSRSLDLATRQDNRVGIAAATGQTGKLALDAGLGAPAHRLYSDSLQIYREEENVRGMAACLHHLGNIARGLGYTAAAEDCYRRSIELEKSNGDLPGVAITLSELAKLPFADGALQFVVDEYEQFLAEYEIRHNSEGRASVLKLLGDCALRSNDKVLAENYYGKSLKINEEIGDERGKAIVLGQMSTLARLRADWDKARQLLEASMKAYSSVGDEDGIARCLFQLGQLAEIEHKLPDAREFYKRSMELWLQSNPAEAPFAASAFSAIVPNPGKAGDAPQADNGEAYEVNGSSSASTGQAGDEEMLDFEYGTWSLAETIIYLGDHLEDSGSGDAVGIAEILGGLAPAARLAVATINAAHIPLAAYEGELRTRLEQLSKEGRSYSRLRSIMVAACMVSLDHVSAKNEPSVEFLKLLLFVGPYGIQKTDLISGRASFPEELAAILSGAQALEAALALLEQYSLVRSRGNATFVNPLVQTALVEHLTEAENHHWAEAAVVFIGSLLPSDLNSPASMTELTRLIGPALFATAHCEFGNRRTLDAVRVLDAVGSFFLASGSTAKCLILYAYALGVLEELMGADSPEVALQLNNLALAQARIGNHGVSKALYERALKIEVPAEPEYLDNLGKLVSNYGHALLDEGNYDEAWAHFDWARQLHERLHGEAHITTAVDINNLGLVRSRQQKWEDAKNLLQQSKRLMEECSLAETPDYANVLMHLSPVCFHLGDSASARQLASQALEIRERHFGELHPAAIEARAALGTVLELGGDHAAALGHFDQAVTLATYVYGKRHVRTRQLLGKRNHLASIDSKWNSSS